MTKKTKFDVLYRKLGYTFQKSELLQTALTHRSCGSNNNERLEFLGDSILNFIVAESLYYKFPHAREGELSRLRASLVKGDTLAEVARELDLGEHLLLGEGELKSGGFRRASILADAVEAILGAIYLESGLEVARERVDHWFDERLQNASITVSNKDAKSRLQEWLQARRLPLPEYAVVEQQGEAHNQNFTVTCSVKNVQNPTVATASSRKQAEKQAAVLMLAQLEGNKA